MDFITQTLNGLGLGSIYALVALGYSMVYGIVQLINFAHGDIIMVGGYVLYLVHGQQRLGLPLGWPLPRPFWPAPWRGRGDPAGGLSPACWSTTRRASPC